jgi:DNA-binding MarR family transcriptional regulator
VNGVDLYRLGRRLMKLGLDSFPPSTFAALPSSYRMVLTDVFEHPHSSITEITARTGFPQSHVSAAVAHLREAGVFATRDDPADRRRTLVCRSPESEAAAGRLVAPIEAVIDDAVANDPYRAQIVIAALEQLAAALLPVAPGPASLRAAEVLPARHLATTKGH